jgi:putative nucleotidyltransferase with HDIG domain
MLGLNTVKNLALSTAIIRSVGQAKKSKALPIKEFWVHSIGVGVMAKLLAIERGLPLADREEYFVAGLLHDLGKIPFGDEYTDVLVHTKATQEPLIRLEQRVMDIDHEEVGHMIASKWKLNPVITDAICHHHAPILAAPENQALVATVALADFYICLFDIGYAGNRFPDEEQLPLLLEMCELEWDAIVNLSEAVDAEIKKAEIFLQI